MKTRDTFSRSLSQDDDFQRYMAEVTRHSTLNRDEERRLAERYQRDGDLEAARRLVVANLRFVVRIANEYRGYGLPFLDLVQEGNVGLMKAVRRFDPARGNRLITYAAWWIRSQIHAFIMKAWSLVKLGTGRRARALFWKLGRVRADVEAANGGPVSDAQLASRFDVSEEELARLRARSWSRDASLDAPIAADGPTHLERLASPAHQHDATARAELRARVRAFIDDIEPQLPRRQRYLLRRRLLSESPPSFATLGEELGVSRQRVQQLEKRLLRRLREAFTQGPDAALA